MRAPSAVLWPAILLGMLSVHPLSCAAAHPEPEVNTFSIVAFDPATKDIGVAVASRYLAVGSVVPWAKAGVGAVATQALAKIDFGPQGLQALATGKAAPDVLKALIESDPRSATRQVALVDAKGKVAAHTGAECLDFAGHRLGDTYSVQGNILAGEEVLKAMQTAYEDARQRPESELADWLIATLQAAESAGGDKRGKQSAAILVVRENGGPGGDNDRYIDLRVDDHENPVRELARLLGLHNQFHPHLHAPKPGKTPAVPAR